MASKFIRRSRFIGDDRNVVPIYLDITAGAVSPGDFIGKTNPTAGITSAAGAYPLSDLTDSGTLLQNQQAARDRFVGIAQAPAAAAANILMPTAVSGVFDVPCLSGTYEVGYLVGMCGTTAGVANGGNDGVSASTVQRVTDLSAAIGRVIKRGTTITTVRIEILSRLTDRVTDDTFVADTISENTATNGVVADGVRLKDGIVWTPQGAPDAQSGTSFTITAARMLGKLITSTNAAAVTATVDTGTAMDTAITSIVGTDAAFDWSIINLGSASGACTVTAASGHTLVGNMVVAISTTGRFRTRRTAANTWITYRLS